MATTDQNQRAYILRISAESGADFRTVKRHLDGAVKRPSAAIVQAIEQAKAKLRARKG